MAQFRQAVNDRSLLRPTFHDPSSDQTAPRFFNKTGRNRRASKPHRRLPSAAVIAAILFIFLLVFILSVLPQRHREYHDEFDDGGANPGSISGFLANRFRRPKVLGFGRGSGIAGGDSRYWERDDRRRDPEFNEDEVTDSKGGQVSDKGVNSDHEKEKRGVVAVRSTGSGERLYNEGGRAELDSYNENFENSLKDERRLEDSNVVEEDKYDDGIDFDDNWMEGNENTSEFVMSGKNATEGKKGKEGVSLDSNQAGGNLSNDQNPVAGELEKPSATPTKLGPKKKPHNKNYSSCDMKLLNSTAQLVEPVENKKFTRFSLQYTYAEERPSGSQHWIPRFAGHQTLEEREESYHAHDQTVNCGFVKGPIGVPSTGFDIKDADVRYIASCHIAVVSCIFGNSDNLRTPHGKTITRQAKKNVCFVMFMDEHTMRTLLSEGQRLDSTGFIGLWKIVVVKNLPFPDMRRVGKVPKFLTHRLFPTARYSIWLDSKLRLQRDPILVLEYFLWRGGYEYAISNHYDRHCVWEEVMQNKKLNKVNHTIIDQQFAFYQADGLKRFNTSDPHKLLPSYVPEGSFIVRVHTPMSNLFSCLWFNEVDRFTPRDQLSFAYTYLKLRRMNPGKVLQLNMFKVAIIKKGENDEKTGFDNGKHTMDCERRSVAKLYRHRTEDKRNLPVQKIR